MLPCPVGITSLCDIDDTLQREYFRENEIWTLDQANTVDTTGNGLPNAGGVIYIQDSNSNQAIILGREFVDWAIAKTGAAPIRPHAIAFNRSMTHALIAFLASGHVLFMDAIKRTFVDILLIAPEGAPFGGTHTVYPYYNEKYAVATDFSRDALVRIKTDYRCNRFEIDAVLSLTPLQIENPNLISARPIYAITNNPTAEHGPDELGYATFANAGLLLFDPLSEDFSNLEATVIDFYDRSDGILPVGLLMLQQDDQLYFNSGSGTGDSPITFSSHLYRTRIQSPLPENPEILRSRPPPNERTDMHGLALVGDYLWTGDRAANKLIIYRGTELIREVTWPVQPNIAVDFLTISDNTPGEVPKYVFAALRGPIPLSGNNPLVNNSVGSKPGIAVFRVLDDGASGELVHIYRTFLPVGCNETSDPHGNATRFTNVCKPCPCKKSRKHVPKNNRPNY